MQVNKNTEVSIEFRIEFKKEYGIDYVEAVNRLKEQSKERERRWNELLIKHKVIN